MRVSFLICILCGAVSACSTSTGERASACVTELAGVGSDLDMETRCHL
jgi:hypothetical protein